HEDKKLYLCPRKVSTVLCVHDVANDTDSSSNDGGGGGLLPVSLHGVGRNVNY
uniref:Uncharacterized protein n=1 Tax=Amphimedon queenslandica TaxID=400682 RepID=A0A1X7T886_AMPQE